MAFNHPFNKEACKKRLLEEYKKYGKLIVAFDYDNTIFDYHNKGGDYSCVIELLQDCTRYGFELVLFTSEENESKIKQKQIECFKLWIGNHEKVGKKWEFVFPYTQSSILPNSKKPYYNILLDDRAGLEESYEILKYVVDEISKSCGEFRDGN